MDLGKLLESLVRRGRTLSLIMLVVMAGIVLADIIIPPAYKRFPWDGIGGFYAVYGFLSCVVIIAVAKLLGHYLLYRPENYYRDEQRDD